MIYKFPVNTCNNQTYLEIFSALDIIEVVPTVSFNCTAKAARIDSTTAAVAPS